MPEGAHPYPRWEGPLSTGSLIGVVVGQEVRRAFRNYWAQLVFLFIGAYTFVYIAQLASSATGGVSSAHTVKTYVDFLNDLRFGALFVGGLVAGPSLLEDVRRGGLELYLSRAVSHRDYLIGKVAAVFGLVTLSMFGPALVYWVATGVILKEHPPGWGMALAGALGYSLLWGLVVSGLGMGLSAIARTSMGAALLLIAGPLVLELFVVALLQPITRQKILTVISPLTALRAQTSWLFKLGTKVDLGFHYLWGLLVLGLLIVVGWGLVAWKRPRVRGADA